MTKIILFGMLLAVIMLVGCANFARREKDINYMPRCGDDGLHLEVEETDG